MLPDKVCPGGGGVYQHGAAQYFRGDGLRTEGGGWKGWGSQNKTALLACLPFSPFKVTRGLSIIGVSLRNSP